MSFPIEISSLCRTNADIIKSEYFRRNVLFTLSSILRDDEQEEHIYELFESLAKGEKLSKIDIIVLKKFLEDEKLLKDIKHYRKLSIMIASRNTSNINLWNIDELNAFTTLLKNFFDDPKSALKDGLEVATNVKLDELDIPSQ